jgi:hypothetical protein
MKPVLRQSEESDEDLFSRDDNDKSNIKDEAQKNKKLN